MKTSKVKMWVFALLFFIAPISTIKAEECCSWSTSECSGAACTGPDWYWMVIVCEDGSWGYWSGNYSISLPCPE